jgi:hypothetical protein
VKKKRRGGRITLEIVLEGFFHLLSLVELGFDFLRYLGNFVGLDFIAATKTYLVSHHDIKWIPHEIPLFRHVELVTNGLSRRL